MKACVVTDLAKEEVLKIIHLVNSRMRRPKIETLHPQSGELSLE